MNLLYEVTECPLCHSKNHSYLTSASTRNHTIYLPWLLKLTWQFCKDCGHIFRKEGFTEDGFKELMTYVPSQLSPHIVYERRDWFTTLKDIVHPGTTVLDVGAGNGAGSMVALELGAKVTALDTRKIFLESLNKLGINTICTDINTLDTSQTYDVVLACDIIEHVADPIAVLKKLKELCKNTLLISTPDAESPFFKAQGQDNVYWYELEHLHIFSRKRLQELLSELDMKVFRFELSPRYICGIDLFCTP